MKAYTEYANAGNQNARSQDITGSASQQSFNQSKSFGANNWNQATEDRLRAEYEEKAKAYDELAGETTSGNNAPDRTEKEKNPSGGEKPLGNDKTPSSGNEDNPGKGDDPSSGNDKPKDTPGLSSAGWEQITQQDIADTIGLQELSGIIGDESALKKRQHILDPKNYRAEYKKPNPGKMPNNNDPFPVDLKIEEFETHYPPTYIYSLNACAMAKEAAAGAMAVGFNASKRLIKIENNLSTLMRYFFRLAARVPINCVYYGGQVAGSQAKYACIRCLCDDRITDGMLVQIDQCLTCTRYEPVFGRVFIIVLF